MPAGLPSNATRFTRRSRKSPSLSNPRLSALAKSLVPTALYEKLDPFEASIEAFVRGVSAEIPAGKRVLDAGAGDGRFKSFFAHAEYIGVDFGQGDPAWNYSGLDVI